MQASYASGCALGLPHRILGTRKSMRTIQYGFACLMRTFSEATEARSAVVAGQTEGRMTSQAHAASLLYVHPHPTAARRAATLASSGCEMRKGVRTSLRPLQSRFKARKKPEGYTSTPTGLQCLKTQITASRINENGKGTPSGVPQPIHKRKLILVKEEFDASSSGGGAENRTPVHTKPSSKHYKLSRCFGFSISKPIDRPLKYLAGSIFFLRIPATPQEAFL